MLLLDLDELDRLDARLRAFSLRGWALSGFRERDHLDGSTTPLRHQVQALLDDAGIDGGGPVRLLCMPRILGHAFNPLSVYFCHRPDGRLSAILYEVNNTFGERHSYLIPAPAGSLVEQSAAKDFFVSPFMDMDLSYAFKVRPPGDLVGVAIDVSDPDGKVLTAAFHGAREPLTDRSLVRAWLAHPLMSVGVLAGIHWEALKIWLKGGRLRPRPPRPPPVTVAPQPFAAATTARAFSAVTDGAWPGR